jgi:uncharacterized protein
MPLIKSAYKAPILFRNSQFSTIYASVFRKVNGVKYDRERLELSDGDFVDLDWSKASSKQTKNLVIITHGLLGNSDRQYVKGTVKYFNQKGWDALAWNHRGMSGEPNRFEKMTIHGSTDELKEIIEHVNKSKKYDAITLVGWSKGGNIALKYTGELGRKLPKQIKSIVAISVPTDVYGSVHVMGKNSFYAKRFKTKFYEYLKNKKHLIDPEKFAEFGKYETLEDFSEYYVAPLNGYKNAKEYYQICSALPYLENITVPTLIINSLDDPILSLTCSPFQLAENSEIIHLETPKSGGHCSFYLPNNDGIYWAEKRAFEFVNSFFI